MYLARNRQIPLPAFFSEKEIREVEARAGHAICAFARNAFFTFYFLTVYISYLCAPGKIFPAKKSRTLGHGNFSQAFSPQSL